MKTFKFILILFLPIIGILSCQDAELIKPAAQLRLSYPEPVYDVLESDCAYSFDINKNASASIKEDCDINIKYPNMKATLYITYQKVRPHNLDSLLIDAQKLAYNHTIKANSIPEQPFINPDEDVYGMFYMINGNAATQAGFYVTDSVNHFLNGALYFDAKPNFDSIYPAVVYLREDMRRIMETLKWKEKN